MPTTRQNNGLRVSQLTAPTITLAGTLAAVDDDGNITTSAVTGLDFQGSNVKVTDDSPITYETEPVQLFVGGSVDAAFSCDYPMTTLPYVTKPNGIVIYSDQPNGENVGMSRAEALASKAEIRYTINGKDPSRTKYSVVNDFTTVVFQRNYSGDDNTVIKARVYYRGEWSPVTVVKIRIADPSQFYVNED